MTRQEYLLTVLAEECNEVAQRCTKALRFGLNEVQPGQELTNAQRIMVEYIDLMAIAHILQEESLIQTTPADYRDLFFRKKDKIEEFYNYSRTLGVLHE